LFSCILRAHKETNCDQTYPFLFFRRLQYISKPFFNSNQSNPNQKIIMFSSKASFSPDAEAALETSVSRCTRVMDWMSGVRDRFTGLNIPKFCKANLRKLLLLTAGVSACIVTFVILAELRTYAAHKRVDEAVLSDSVWDQPIPPSFNSTDVN
jgi:hypothetical protein